MKKILDHLGSKNNSSAKWKNIYSKFHEVLSDLLHSPFFWCGLFIKITLGIALSSIYLSEYFIPFSEKFLEHKFINPYSYFYEHGQAEVFPYPMFMLLILSIPKFVFGVLFPKVSSSFLILFIYRLPILIADFSILMVLWAWLRKRVSVNRVLFFYWFSPVLMYINYVHGQLDVIPIALVFASIFFLLRGRICCTAIILGIALSTKLHIVLIIPFFILYLVLLKISWQRMLLFVGLIVGTFAFFNISVLFSSSFINMVFFNKQQNRVFSLFYSYASGYNLYIVPALYVVLLVWGYSQKYFYRDNFILFLAFAFGLLLVCTLPMQGWYYWILPFFTYFYIKDRKVAPSLFILLQGMYFI